MAWARIRRKKVACRELSLPFPGQARSTGGKSWRCPPSPDLRPPELGGWGPPRCSYRSGLHGEKFLISRRSRFAKLYRPAGHQLCATRKRWSHSSGGCASETGWLFRSWKSFSSSRDDLRFRLFKKLRTLESLDATQDKGQSTLSRPAASNWSSEAASVSARSRLRIQLTRVAPFPTPCVRARILHRCTRNR